MRAVPQSWSSDFDRLISGYRVISGYRTIGGPPQKTVPGTTHFWLKHFLNDGAPWPKFIRITSFRCGNIYIYIYCSYTYRPWSFIIRFPIFNFAKTSFCVGGTSTVLLERTPLKGNGPTSIVLPVEHAIGKMYVVEKCTRDKAATHQAKQGRATFSRDSCKISETKRKRYGSSNKRHLHHSRSSSRH